MPRTDDPYSRVYWRAVDDPKFEAVWWDDQSLATWLRLLVAADMAWPASANLYDGVSRRALKRLVDAGLVVLDRRQYRIKGLDREREKRSGQARAAVAARQDRREPPPDASDDDGLTPDVPRAYASTTNGATPDVPSQEEPRRAKPRRAEESARTDAVVYDTTDELDVWYRLTARAPSRQVTAWLGRLVADHGEDAVVASLVAAHGADPDLSTLLSRTQNRLWEAGHEASREGERARIAALELRKREDAERDARLAAQTPEERAANVARVRAELVARGVLPPEPEPERKRRRVNGAADAPEGA